MTARLQGAQLRSLSARETDRTVFGRMGRNITWLVGSKGFGGAASLGYLAFAAHGLGLEGFGNFSLILAYGQAIASLAEFQSWQAVIRYGADQFARGDREALGRLLGFTATIDGVSAILGAVVAVAGVAAAGPLLGWSAQMQHRAALFGAILLFSTGGTPTGMLRLDDRFDLIAYAQGVAPLIRLLGSLVAWLQGLGLDVFLGIWAGAALAQLAASWIAALACCPHQIRFGRAAFARAKRENGGIGRFMIATNLSTSLNAVGRQLSILGIGGTAGAAVAGGFRVAMRLARGLAKPLQMLTRVLYPELARLVATGNRETLARVSHGVARLSIGSALLLFVVATLLASPLLRLFAGPAFHFAAPFVVLLAIASAIDISGFLFEPLLIAHGRAGAVLRVRAVGAVAYIALLTTLLWLFGPVGAAFAAIAASMTMRVLLARSASGLRDPAMRDQATMVS